MRGRDRLLAWRSILGDAWRKWSPRWQAARCRSTYEVLNVLRRLLVVPCGTRRALEVHSLDALMKSHRFRPSSRLTVRVKRELPALHNVMEALIEKPWSERLEEVGRRSIVLKKPRLHGEKLEKGVLLVAFTFNFPFFYRHIDCGALLREYHVVLEPSWSDYCQPSFLFWTRFDEPVVVQATEPRDRKFLHELGSNLHAVPFGASNWVDSRLFHPLEGAAKDFDVVYVANYSLRKRHHLLLRALRQLRPHRLRAALVCHSWGNGKESLHRLATHYGVENQVEWFEDLPPDEVNAVLNRSKCSVLLSRQEGSNRSLFEGFFASVPGILLSGNIGVNKEYVNSETGLLIEERELPSALLYLRDRWRDFRPREWAQDHISPPATTRKLAAVLRNLQPEEPWTQDPVPKVNRPELFYFDEEDGQRLPAAAEVLRRFLRPGGTRRDATSSALLEAAGPASS